MFLHQVCLFIFGGEKYFYLHGAGAVLRVLGPALAKVGAKLDDNQPERHRCHGREVAKVF